MNLPRFYQERTAYYPRTNTDVLFQLLPGSMHFGGEIDRAVRWIEREQLTDADLWAVFVEQFRSCPDDADNGWRSEYWGKVMRGAVFVYQYTQNPALYALLENTVRDLLSAQDELGRITTYSVANEFCGWDVWGRKYVLLGLQYFLDICADEILKADVIAAMCRHADYILAKIGQGEGKIPITETSNYWGGMNASSILEPFVRLYSITGEEKYLDFAGEIVSGGAVRNFNLFEAALEGKLFPFEYPETKAYEMMSCFEGLLEYYRVTGIEKWKTAVIRFANLIMESDITIIGSAGCTHELFDHSRVRQFDPRVTGIMQETCVTVTWMKLCFQLLSLTGDAIYADAIECSAYNALFGAVNYQKNTADGQVLPFDSYSPLLFDRRGKAVGGKKKIDGDRFYGCCAAIGAAGLGLLTHCAVMQNTGGLTVNLYAPGSVEAYTPNGNPVLLAVKTEYPIDGTVTIAFRLQEDERFTLAFRIPKWSKTSSLAVNGKEIKAERGGYSHITRTWKNGDAVTIVLDMRARVIHAEALDPQADTVCANHFAVVRGPVVLARDAKAEGSSIEEPLLLPSDVHELFVVSSASDMECNGTRNHALRLPSGEILYMTDYAQAGQTWDEAAEITVWMPKRSVSKT